MIPDMRRGNLLVMALAMSVAFLSSSVAAESDHDRVEGIVEAVLGPNATQLRTGEKVVTVDLTALGGVTVAVTPGTRIVAIGTLDANGDVLHARRLESPTSR
jgi:hypothetical protein